MQAERYFFDDGSSRKFWSYTLKDTSHTIWYGRIGTAGREIRKDFESSVAAKADIHKLVAQKLKGGYRLVDPTHIKIKKTHGKKPATKKQIADLEKRIGAKLPDEYKQFLLTQNGGIPEEHGIVFPKHPYIAGVMIATLFGLYPGLKPEHTNLNFYLQRYELILPAGHLPIAIDVCGDVYTLSLNDKPGCVYFWDHESVDENNVELDDGQAVFEMKDATLLAGSFNELLARMDTSMLDE
jgi:predicted DNA-binding WGR domain protein